MDYEIGSIRSLECEYKGILPQLMNENSENPEKKPGQIVALEYSSSAPKDQQPIIVESPRLEQTLTKANLEELPSGEALSQSMRQTVITGRSQSYKIRTTNKYGESVKRVFHLYRSTANKENFSAAGAKELVNSFIDILKSDRDILLNLSNMPVSDEDYLYAHAVNVTLLTLVIAAAVGYTQGQTMDVGIAALLQDLGMVMVPEAILSKSEPLTPEELQEIHKHPVQGANMLDAMVGLPPVSLLAIYQHHERLTGSGYPKKKPGALIHQYARIMAIADTYAAMTAKRKYRKRYPPYQAMSSLVKLGASGHLDSAFIRKFIECMSLFPLGSLVKLSSGRVGKVVHANPSDFTKPTIAILWDENAKPVSPPIVVELKSSSGENIVQALDDESGYVHKIMDGF